MAILTAKALACYIIQRYKGSNSDRQISGIKLQKALYFSFAFWGGFIRKSKSENVEEQLIYDEILFDEPIEAWSYGPVVPEVFRLDKDGKLLEYCEEKNKLFPDEFVEETLNSIIDDIFSTSDFKLVDISHADKCWIDNYDFAEIYHNNVIDKEKIIQEYATK